MARYGMLINTRKCIGCYACLLACQRQNDLDPETHFIRFEDREMGEYPTATVEHIPIQCMHCEDAPCVSVCPTGASYATEDGIVRVDEERCIGCKYCMVACPYHVRTQDPATGVVDKCRMCVQIDEETGRPGHSCVKACLTGARMFGDLDDPESEISKEIAATKAVPLAGDRTKAKIFYVR